MKATEIVIVWLRSLPWFWWLSFFEQPAVCIECGEPECECWASAEPDPDSLEEFNAAVVVEEEM